MHTVSRAYMFVVHDDYVLLKAFILSDICHTFDDFLIVRWRSDESETVSDLWTVIEKMFSNIH